MVIKENLAMQNRMKRYEGSEREIKGWQVKKKKKKPKPEVGGD